MKFYFENISNLSNIVKRKILIFTLCSLEIKKKKKKKYIIIASLTNMPKILCCFF